MEFIPAIDLLDGACVRLTQGSYSDVERYQVDPVETARGFAAQGARRIHLVDLNAARGSSADERRSNRDIIRRIAATVDIAVEVGGGVRSEQDVAELLSAGVSQVVVGTTLAKNPEEVARWIRRWGPVILAGIDARDGQVKVSGWEESSGITDIELARKAAEIGCAGIIYTNIARDGMMQGADIESTNRVAAAAGIPVILSGGISSNDDLNSVIAEGHPLIAGVISGKAIYEQALDVKKALESCRSSSKTAGHARIWNFDGRWSAVTNRMRPALVLDQHGTVRAVVQQNPKAVSKSTEQSEVWHVLPANGRVLPAGIGSHRVTDITDHDSCVEIRAVFSKETAAAAGDESEAARIVPGDSGQPEAGPESVLNALEMVIRERKKKLPEGSYTTHLFASGEEKIRKKTGEEAVELILARENPEMISESADLIYHLLVLLAQRDIPLKDVIRELSQR
ncbi:MAG: 1-(5-phosphoribosyl)-5-[(5-phosphoribosylamino)methylideneamino]imidazole-4-carboxamide isomerase [Spirochaeta sp.]